MKTLMKKKSGGRVAAHEIMIGTPAIRNLIREDKVAQMYSAIQTGSALTTMAGKSFVEYQYESATSTWYLQ